MRWAVVAVVAVAAHWDSGALRGEFLYDDAGSVEKNVVVNGEAPWTDALWKRDFWGEEMAAAGSHKSFRPLTTLSFRANWLLAQQQDGKTGVDTFGFHAVNVMLHAVVSGLATAATGVAIRTGDSQRDSFAAIVSGMLFALHPVHVEAVANITGRAELAMALFYLSGFLIFSSYLDRWVGQWSVWRCFVSTLLPCICMILSLLSKEQGVSTLVSCCVLDFSLHVQSIQNVVQYARGQFHKQTVDTTETRRNSDQKYEMVVDNESVRFFAWRTAFLAVETVLVSVCRLMLNGDSKPDFIKDQNPAAFATDRFTRILSINYIYCLYIFDVFWPFYLSCDWSGDSIKLITEKNDPRCIIVLTFWITCTLVTYMALFRASTSSVTRRAITICWFGLTISPFLVSSNLLVVIGTMKADRIIYLPILGFTALLGYCLQLLLLDKKKESTAFAIVAGLCAVCFGVTSVRTHAWSKGENLWKAAFEVNPVSRHTRYNYAYAASRANNFEVAENVLAPLLQTKADRHDFSNVFLYSLILLNLNRCNEALPLLEEGLVYVVERKQSLADDNPRNSLSSIVRHESNLLTAKGLCTEDIPLRGKILYRAVEVDPSNSYALQQAEALLRRVNQVQAFQKQQEQLRSEQTQQEQQKSKKGQKKSRKRKDGR